MHRLLNINLLRVSLILFLLGFTSFKVSAQQATATSYSLSLKEAIALAMENQVAIQNAKLNEQIAQKKVNEITGIGLPQVNGSLDFNDYLTRPTQLLPGEFFGQPPGTFIPIQFGTQYNSTAGVSASQLIFDGSYLVGLKAARTYKELAKKSTQSTKQEVAANVAKAYYSVQIAENSLNFLDANVERLSKTYNDLQAMYEAGFAEKVDADRLKVSLNNLRIERQKLGNLVELTRNLLKFQIGLPLESTITLTDKLSENPQAAPASIDMKFENRVEYSLLQTQRELNILDIKRHQAGYLPSIAGFGSLSYQAQRDQFNFFDTDQQWFRTAIIGAKLTLPIFDGLQKRARVQTAKLELAKTDNNLLNLQNAIDLELQNVLTQYRNNYQTLQAMKENLELAQEIVRVSQIKYEEGVGSSLEVINAESSLKEAQTNYYDILFDLLVSQIDLQKAQGILIYE